ncbi:MAG: DUF2306 domain-containing protein [Leeuwenhoekiella sp.]
MDTITLVHSIFSVIALFAGSVVLLKPKGTPFHVKTGYTYVLSMLILLATSFFIFDLFNAFGAYHVMAIISFITLGLGMYFPLFARNKKNWAIQHYMWMSYSYVGLVMAGGSHLFGLVDWPSWLSIVVFWGLPYVVGSILIFRNRKKILENVKRRTGLDITVR